MVKSPYNCVVLPMTQPEVANQQKKCYQHKPLMSLELIHLKKGESTLKTSGSDYIYYIIRLVFCLVFRLQLALLELKSGLSYQNLRSCLTKETQDATADP